VKLKYGYITIALLVLAALIVGACVPVTPAPATAPTEAAEAMEGRLS
jgi:hypothetical protein